MNEIKYSSDEPLSKDELIANYWDEIATPDLGYEQNTDGSLMSHMTVEVDQNGYPIGSDKDEKKWIFVDE